MNWLDWTLIGIAVVSILEGARQGLTRSALGMVSLLAGIFLAAWFYGVAAAMLQPFVSHESLAKVLGFLFIFVTVQLMGALLGWLLSLVWKVAMLSWLDRTLGGAFGLVKAGLIGIVLVMVLMAFPRMPLPFGVTGSRIAPYLVGASEVLTALAPRELREGFAATYERVREFWKENVPVRGRGRNLPRDTAYHLVQ